MVETAIVKPAILNYMRMRMPSQRMRERAIILPPKYAMIKDNQRTLLCKRTINGKTVPCLTRFRIKAPEPGVQSRTCPSCGKVSYFVLRLTSQRTSDDLQLLRFQWITSKEAHSIEQASLQECIDLGISRNV